MHYVNAIGNTLMQNNFNSNILTHFQTQLPVADMFRQCNLSAKDSLVMLDTVLLVYYPYVESRGLQFCSRSTKTLLSNSISYLTPTLKETRMGSLFVHRRNVYVCSNRKYKSFAISEEKDTAPLKIFKRSQPQIRLRSLAKTFHWSLSI